jgi:mitotic spindle assembly checkpoint protein MAD2
MSRISSTNKSPVHLKGSIDIVVEFFNYGINSILYQRGLYPSNSFIQREKYGLPLLVTTNVELKRYLDVVLNQMRKFLETKNVHKIVIVILKTNTGEPVERWQFDVELERDKDSDNNNLDSTIVNADDERRALKEIQEGIRGVIRQITASVTFLPTLEGSHSFDILLYTDRDVELPNSEWSDTNAKLINNGQHVQLRGFTTNIHKVEPIVSYVHRD